MMIDSSDATSDEQRQAAKDFLAWLADSDEGPVSYTHLYFGVPPV